MPCLLIFKKLIENWGTGELNIFPHQVPRRFISGCSENIEPQDIPNTISQTQARTRQVFTFCDKQVKGYIWKTAVRRSYKKFNPKLGTRSCEDLLGSYNSN